MKLSQKYDFDFTKTFIAYQNWNEIWETHFQPIRIDNFVAVRADFHAITEGVTFELVVNPKMAFGTGHHETTYMMLENMQNIDFHGKKVLDFGAGTGILGILASKMGAAAIEAVDIEEASYENMIENCHMNNVHNMLPIHGVLDDVISTDFDIILANINRNIIIDSLQDLKNRLGTEGRYLLISGFLKQDENVIFQAINYAGFQQMKVSQKGNWLCMLLRN